MEELAELDMEIRACASASGLQVFPANLDVQSALIAMWPDTDWRSFLALASECGVPLIYLGSFVLTEEELADRSAALGDQLAPRDGRTAIAGRHVGEVSAVQLAYVVGGVAHLWEQRASWYEELLDEVRIEREVRRGSRSLERAEREQQDHEIKEHTDEWAAQLAEDRDFYSARNDTERRTVAARLVPALGRALALPQAGPTPARSSAIRVVELAAIQARDVVVPRMVADAHTRIGELAAALRARPDYACLTTKAERTRVARGYLNDVLSVSEPGLVAALVAASGP